MKRLVLFSVTLLSSLAVVAQTNYTHQNIPTYAPATFAAEPRQPTAERTPLVPLYTNDVVIDNSSAIDQRRVRISVAFNGWLYAAYSTFDAATTTGGITIKMSRDNGITWNSFDAYSSLNIQYPAIDIVVAGTDTNNLTLYMAGINHNTSSGVYVLFVDRYNATTGAFIGSNYNLNAGTRQIYDVAVASDYLFPATGANPYSVGLLYSTYSSSYDSIVFLSAGDGGNTWNNRRVVATTGSYNHAVSLAYGRSLSGSNGRYFAAWERLPGGSARTGNIFTSRCASTFDDVWIPPVNLDSISATMIGLCRNPSIATSFGTVDNDSGSVTAVVLVDRDYTGDGSDYDMLGFYNKRAHYTNFWYRLDIVNNNEKDIQSDISYDPTNQNFLATYYDSTNGKLPYIVNNFNLIAPSTWTTINGQYNDLTTNLKAAYPRVEINPVAVQAAHAWIAEGVGNNGVAMFDAEYNITGVQSQQANASITQVFPNPASETATVSYSLRRDADVKIAIYNLLGEELTSTTTSRTAGQFTETLDVKNLPAGMYMIQVQTGNQTVTKSLVVTH